MSSMGDEDDDGAAQSTANNSAAREDVLGTPTDGNVDVDVDTVKQLARGTSRPRWSLPAVTSFVVDAAETESPDGGWGWAVVAASFTAHMIADGFGFSFGVLFTELLVVFGETKSRTAWIGSLFVSVPAICGPVAGALTTRFGCRWTTIAGSVIASAGCLASAFTTSVDQLCFTFGVISGFGLALVFVPAVVVVAFYFEKKRAFATGLAVAGSGIGTFVLPPLADWLLTKFLWRGALIICSAILLNIVVCGAVYRPITSHSHRRRLSADLTNMATNMAAGSRVLRHARWSAADVAAFSSGRLLTDRGHVGGLVDELAEHDRSQSSANAVSMDHPRSDMVNATAAVKHGSAGVHSLQAVGQCMTAGCRRRWTTVDLSVFRSAVFNYFCLHTMMLYVSYDIPYIYGPVRAVGHGMSPSSASFLVSIIGISTTVGQVAIGYVSDRSSVDTLTFYSLMTSLAGLATLVVPLVTSFSSLAAVNAAYGLFVSANYALTTVILVKVVGVDRLTDAVGIISFAQGIANLVGPPLAGWLSDITGSYDPAFCGAGAIIFLSGLMMFVVPCITGRIQRREQRPPGGAPAHTCCCCVTCSP